MFEFVENLRNKSKDFFGSENDSENSSQTQVKQGNQQNVNNNGALQNDYEQGMNTLKPYLIDALKKNYTPNKLARQILENTRKKAEQDYKQGKITREQYEATLEKYSNLQALASDPQGIQQIFREAQFNYNQFINDRVKDFNNALMEKKNIGIPTIISYIQQTDPDSFKKLLGDKKAAQVVADYAIKLPKEEDFSWGGILKDIGYGLISAPRALMSAGVMGVGKLINDPDMEERGYLMLVHTYAPTLSMDEIAKLSDEEKRKIIATGVITDTIFGLLGGAGVIGKGMTKAFGKVIGKRIVSKGIAKNLGKLGEVADLDKLSIKIEEQLGKEGVEEVLKETGSKSVKELLSDSAKLSEVVTKNPIVGYTLSNILKNTGHEVVKVGVGKGELAKIGEGLSKNLTKIARYSAKFGASDLGKLGLSVLNLDKGAIAFQLGIGLTAGLAGYLANSNTLAHKVMMPFTSLMMLSGIGKAKIKQELAEEFQKRYGINPLDYDMTNPFRQKFEKLVDFKYNNSSLTDVFVGDSTELWKYVLGNVLESGINAVGVGVGVNKTIGGAKFVIDNILTAKTMSDIEKIQTMIDNGEDLTKVLIETKRMASNVKRFIDQLRASRFLEDTVKEINDMVDYIGGEQSHTYLQLKNKLKELDENLAIAQKDPKALQKVKENIDEIKNLMEEHIKSTVDMGITAGLSDELKKKIGELNYYKNILINLKQQTGVVTNLKKGIIKWLAPNEFSYSYQLFNKDFGDFVQANLDEYVGSTIAFYNGIKSLNTNKELINKFIDKHSEISQVIKQKVAQTVHQLGLDPNIEPEIIENLYNDLMSVTLKTIIYKGFKGEFKAGTDVGKVVDGVVSEVLAKFFNIKEVKGKNIVESYRKKIKLAFKDIDIELKKYFNGKLTVADVLKNYNYVKNFEDIIKGVGKNLSIKQKIQLYLLLKAVGNKSIKDIIKQYGGKKGEKLLQKIEEKGGEKIQSILNKSLKEYINDDVLNKKSDDINKFLGDILGKFGEVNNLKNETLKKIYERINEIILGKDKIATGLLQDVALKAQEYEESLEDTVLNKITTLVSSIFEKYNIKEGKLLEDTIKEIKTYNQYALKQQLHMLESLVYKLEMVKKLSDISKVYELIDENNKHLSMVYTLIKKYIPDISRKEIIDFLTKDDINIGRYSIEQVKKLRETLDFLAKEFKKSGALFKSDIETLNKTIEETINFVDDLIGKTEKYKELGKEVVKEKEIKEIEKEIKFLRTKVYKNINKINKEVNELLNELNNRYSLVEDYNEVDLTPGVSITNENLLIQDLKSTLLDLDGKKIGDIDVFEHLGIDRKVLLDWNIETSYDTKKVIKKLKETNDFSIDNFFEIIGAHKVFARDYKEYIANKAILNKKEGIDNFFEYFLNKHADFLKRNPQLLRKFNTIFSGISKRLELYKNGVDRAKNFYTIKYGKGGLIIKKLADDIVDYIFTPPVFKRLLGNEEVFKKLFEDGKIVYVSFDAGIKQIVNIFDFINVKGNYRKVKVGKGKSETWIKDDMQATVIENYKRLIEYQIKHKKILLPSSDTLKGFAIDYDVAKQIALEYITDKDLRKSLNEVNEDNINLIQAILFLKQYGLLDYKINDKLTLGQYIKENLNKSNIAHFLEDVTKIVHSNAKYNSKIFGTEFKVEHKRKPKGILLDDNETDIIGPDGKKLGTKETTDGNIYVIDEGEKMVRKRWYTDNVFLHDIEVFNKESGGITSSKLTYHFDGGIVKGKENLITHEGAAALFLPYVRQDGSLDTSNIERLNRLLEQEGINFKISIPKDENYNSSELINQITFALRELNKKGYTRIIPKSSVKDFAKGLVEGKKAGFSFLPDVEYKKNTAGRDHIEIDTDVYYNVYDGFEINKIKDDGRTFSMQALQHFYGELGRRIIGAIEAYNMKAGEYETIKKISESIKKHGWDAMYRNILEAKGNLVGSKSALIKKIFEGRGNLLEISHPNIIRVMTTLFGNNFVRRYVLKRATLNTLSGMPLAVYNKVVEIANKKMGITGKDFIVASRRNLVLLDRGFDKASKQFAEDIYENSIEATKKVLKSGDYVYGIRYPIGGPKAERAMKVIFIEDLVEAAPEAKELLYFFDNVNGKLIPSADIFINGKEIWLQEADFDGDTINMFWGLSALDNTVFNGELFQSAIAEYNHKVESIPESWSTAEKSSYSDYNKRIKLEENGEVKFHYGKAPILTALVRDYAKKGVSTVSIHARMNAVRDLAIFNLGGYEDEKLIKRAGEISGILQAAVDGNASGKPGAILDMSLTNLEEMFPHLANKGWLSKKYNDEISTRWIDEFFLNDGLMAYNKKSTDMGKALFWNDLSSAIKKTIASYDKIVALKIAEEVLFGKFTKEEVKKFFGKDEITREDYKRLVLSIHRHIILKRLEQYKNVIKDDKDLKLYNLQLESLKNTKTAKAFYDGLHKLIRTFDLPYYLIDPKKETYSPFMNNKIKIKLKDKGDKGVKKAKGKEVEGKKNEFYTDYINNSIAFIDIKPFENKINRMIQIAMNDIKSPANRLGRPELLPALRNGWVNKLSMIYKNMGKLVLDLANKNSKLKETLKIDINLVEKEKINKILEYTKNGQLARKYTYVDKNGRRHVENGLENIINWIKTAKSEEEARTIFFITSLVVAELPKDVISAAAEKINRKAIDKILSTAELYKTRLYGDIGPMYLSSKLSDISKRFSKLGYEGEILAHVQKRILDYLNGDDNAKAEIEMILKDPIGYIVSKKGTEFAANVYSRKPAEYLLYDSYLFGVHKTISEVVDKFKAFWDNKINEDALRGILGDIAKDFLGALNEVFREEFKYMKDIEKIKNSEANPINNSLYALLKIMSSANFEKGGYDLGIRTKYSEIKTLFRQIVEKKLGEQDKEVLEKLGIDQAYLDSILSDINFFHGLLKVYWDQLNNSLAVHALDHIAASEHLKKMFDFGQNTSRTALNEIRGLIENIKNVLGEQYATKVRNATIEFIEKSYNILKEDGAIFNEAKKIALKRLMKNKNLDPEKAFKEALNLVLSKQHVWSTSKLQKATVEKLREASKEYVDDISAAMNEYTTSIIKLLDNNLEIYNTPRKIKERLNNMLVQKAIEQDIKNISSSDALGEMITFMNNFFKTQSLGIAVGRALVEGANAAITVLVNKFGGDIKSLDDVAKYWGFDKPIKIEPKIEHWLYGNEFKLESKFIKSGVDKNIFEHKFRKLNRFLSNFIIALGKKTYELPNEKGRQYIYKIEFANQLNKILEKRIGGDKAKLEYYKHILTDDNLTPSERAIKEALIKEAGRKALKEVKKLFFDYTDNPIFLAKLEQYIPFINFMYNGYRIFLKYPMAWTFLYDFTLNMLNNSVEIDMDDDEFYIRAYKNKPGMLSLALFGFTPYDINALRLLPIEPGSINIGTYPWQKLFMPTGDIDYKRYIDGEISLFEYVLKKVSPTLYDIYYSLTTGDDTRAIRRLTYLTTGLGIMDTTYKDALSAWFNHDYDLLKNPTYLKKLNDWRRKRGLTELTVKDIENIEKFEEVRRKLWGDKYDRNAALTRKLLAIVLASQVIKDDMSEETKEKIYRTYYALYDYLSAKELRDIVINPEFPIEYKKLVKEGVISTLERLGYDKQYLDKLRYYANNAELIKEYYEVTSRLFGGVTINGKKVYDYDGKEDDLAMYLALKYRFKTADGKPEVTVIDRYNYKDDLSYYREKAKLIKKGVLFLPVLVEKPDNKEYITHLTPFFRSYLRHIKGEIIVDLEDYLAEINALTSLKGLYINKALHAGGKTAQEAYWKVVKDIEKQLIDSEERLKRFYPIAYDFLVAKHPNLKKSKTVLDIYKEEIEKDRKKRYSNYYRRSAKKIQWYKSFKSLKDWGYVEKQSGYDPNTLATMRKRINDMHKVFISQLH